ncbi:MAG TPA: hypothetical protein VFO07_08990 [Roseiflexaceae bacterium]|nr:hypothetical protein [Roseiflexaceae bacterium]
MKLHSDYGRLNGFTPEAGRCREFFHQQARKYLVEVGTALARVGVARVRIQRLTASMGSSGGVCAEFRVPGQDAYLEVTVSTAAAVASRSDGVVISARRTGSAEPSHYFDAGLSSDELGRELAGLVDLRI